MHPLLSNAARTSRSTSLPNERVQPISISYVTGIDICGSFYTKSEVRNRAPEKCYVSIFICFATKAVHLELGTDLSTSSFLAALKRFISLRGKPHSTWSDKANNFVADMNELKELHELFFSHPRRSKLSTTVRRLSSDQFRNSLVYWKRSQRLGYSFDWPFYLGQGKWNDRRTWFNPPKRRSP